MHRTLVLASFFIDLLPCTPATTLCDVRQCPIPDLVSWTLLSLGTSAVPQPSLTPLYHALYYSPLCLAPTALLFLGNLPSL